MWGWTWRKTTWRSPGRSQGLRTESWWVVVPTGGSGRSGKRRMQSGTVSPRSAKGAYFWKLELLEDSFIKDSCNWCAVLTAEGSISFLLSRVSGWTCRSLCSLEKGSTGFSDEKSQVRRLNIGENRKQGPLSHLAPRVCRVPSCVSEERNWVWQKL